MTDDELRDLQERSHLVADLVSHPGWDLLCDRAKVTLFARQRRLVVGSAKDFEEYKTEVAWMNGVSFFMDLPAQVQAELVTELETRRELDEAEEDS